MEIIFSAYSDQIDHQKPMMNFRRWHNVLGQLLELPAPEAVAQSKLSLDGSGRLQWPIMHSLRLCEVKVEIRAKR